MEKLLLMEKQLLSVHGELRKIKKFYKVLLIKIINLILGIFKKFQRILSQSKQNQ